jgi:hypothetical protein
VAVSLLGAALHYLVERPCLRLRERRAMRRTSAPTIVDDGGPVTEPG